MNNWTAPQRPNDYAEHALVTAILEGTFPPGSTLPGERRLAADLGVTRPTLREAIQRLARDGWLTVQQGKATAVNDFWREGGLNVLNTLVQHSDELPPNFVANLLQIRLDLAPSYTKQAVARDPDAILDLLNEYTHLPDTPAAYAAFDWRLHRRLTAASGNPIYTLILNGFADFYQPLAQLYFAGPAARAHSRAYYAKLHTAVSHPAPAAAAQLSRETMAASIRIWEEKKKVVSSYQ